MTPATRAVPKLTEAGRRLSDGGFGNAPQIAAATSEAVHAAKGAAPEAVSMVPAPVEARTAFILVIVQFVDVGSRDEFLMACCSAFGQELNKGDEAKLFHAFKATVGSVPCAIRLAAPPPSPVRVYRLRNCLGPCCR